jgi:CheY-like chemotaxis protein
MSDSNAKRCDSGWVIKSGRILVIDNEPAVCASIRRLLEDEYVVETAVGALEALRYLRAGARFDVILCDIMMPGIDGLDLLDAIEREVPEQVDAVVLIGGDLDRPRRVRLHVKSRSCIDKPLDVSRLLALLKERVARARAAVPDRESGGTGS